MKFLNGFKIVLLASAVWGILTYAFYNQIIGSMPLPIAVYVAPTLLFPGMISHAIIANIFRSQIDSRGPYPPVYAYVPNPYTETLGAIISMLIGMAVIYIFWRISK